MGYLLTESQVNYIVKLFITQLLQLNIQRRDAYAAISSLQFKFIENPLVDKVSNEDGWTSIETEEDINDINFNLFPAYVLSNDEASMIRREKAKEAYEKVENAAKNKKKEKEEAKAKLKEEKK